MFTTYILYSKLLNKYYIGFIGEVVEDRLQKHLANHKGFTGKVSDWKIAYTELYNDKKCAMDRETEIKRWKSKKMIEKLIVLKVNCQYLCLSEAITV